MRAMCFCICYDVRKLLWNRKSEEQMHSPKLSSTHTINTLPDALDTIHIVSRTEAS